MIMLMMMVIMMVKWWGLWWRICNDNKGSWNNNDDGIMTVMKMMIIRIMWWWCLQWWRLKRGGVVYGGEILTILLYWYSPGSSMSISMTSSPDCFVFLFLNWRARTRVSLVNLVSLLPANRLVCFHTWWFFLVNTKDTRINAIIMPRQHWKIGFSKVAF